MSEPSMGELTAGEIIRTAQDECDRIIREARSAERADEIRAAVAAETERCAKEVQRVRDKAEFHQFKRDPVSICCAITAAIRSGRGRGDG